MKRKQPTLKDGMNEICIHFMRYFKKLHHGKKTEISPWEWTRRTRKYATHYGINQGALLSALMNRGWFEVSAADAYIVRYDLFEDLLEEGE